MENQDISLDSAQKALCEKYHLQVVPEGDNDVVITVRDPAIAARAKKSKKKADYPSFSGSRDSLDALIAKAIKEGNGVAMPASVQALIDAVEIDPPKDAPLNEDNVVPLRRAVLTEAEKAPETLTDVILDDSGKKVRKTKKEAKHRDNRYARAFRALLENPDATVAEQARIADVTVDMYRWYYITFRHMDRLLREKFGEECIPPLPTLND